MWPLSIKNFTNSITSDLPSENTSLEYPDEHYQLKTTQSGSTYLMY